MATAGLKEEAYFRFKYENDFFNQTDRYYTQGTVIDFIHPMVKHSPLSYCMLRLKNADFNYYGIHLEQDVFTPKSIRYMGGQIYYGERPFTAVFFLSHSLRSVNSVKNLMLYTQFDLGLLGPLAKGEEEQKAIHKALDNIEPQGWDNQLSNSPVFNYNIKIEKAVLIKKHFNVTVKAISRLGTLYTDGALALKCRFGIFDTWFNQTLAKNFNISVYGNIQSRMVAYNSTLQGGIKRTRDIYKLSSSSIKRNVNEFTLGINFVFRRLGLEYSQTFISPEFINGESHGWGSCGITIRI